jgi:alginate O-acetyltransferase complex protein AlgI
MRDYLYIPFGGNRRGPVVYVFATMATMGLCGLWHGAGWTFVVWGLWHGIGLIVCRGWQQLKRPLPSLVGWAVTMLFVLVGWIVFRATNFSTAGSILMSLVGAGGMGGELQEAPLLIIAALACALIPSAHEVMNRVRPLPMFAYGTAALAVYCTLEVGRTPLLNFIYFQF